MIHSVPKEKRWKKRMAGSPKRKKQHKVSPSYNDSIRMYKKSRERSKEKKRETNL